MAMTIPVLPPLVRKPTVTASVPPPDDQPPMFERVPPPPAPMAPPSASPLHDHVRHIMTANPAATPDQVANILGIKSSLAKGVIAEIGQQLKQGYPSGGAAAPPPPNPVTQAFAPPAPSTIAQPPPAVAQAMQTAPPPPTAPSFPAGVQAQPPEMAPGPPIPPQDFGVRIPGYQRPQSVMSAAPGATPDDIPPPPQDAAAARAAMLSTVPGYKSGADAPPGVSPPFQGAPPPAQEKHTNQFLEGLKRFAPDLVTALLTYKNPQVGSGIFQGLAQGRQQVAARDAQQAALDRQTSIDARAQTQQQFENDHTTRTEQETHDYHQLDAAEKFRDDLAKLTPEGQEQAVKSLSPAQVTALGVDPTTFYDENGKFRALTPANKQFNPATQVRVLSQMTPEAQLNLWKGMAKDDFENKYGIPYDTFQPITTTTGAAQAALANYRVVMTGLAKDKNYTTARSTLFKKLTRTNDLGEQMTDVADFNAMFGKYGPQVAMPGSEGAPSTYEGTDAEELANRGLHKALAGQAEANTEAIPEKVAETQRHNKVAELMEKGRLDLGKLNNQIAAGQLQLGKDRLAADKERDNNKLLYEDYKSQAKDGSAKSRYGNAWGKLYDNTMDKLKAASDDLQKWREESDQYGLKHAILDSNGKVTGILPDPQEKVDYINSLRAAATKMQTTTPPAPANFRAWLGKPSGNTTGNNASVIVTPIASSVDTAIKAVRDSGQCQSGHNCESLARQTYEKVDPKAYKGYWDRSPDATALSTLNRFIHGFNGLPGGVAKPYQAGMQIPAGSLLYSTTLNPKSGHVAVTASDGSLNDQYGKNKYAPSNFQWYVPPPTGGKTAPGRQASNGTPSLPPLHTASGDSPVILSGKLGNQDVTFHAPRSKAEFDALTPAKKAAYVHYYQSHKGN